MNNGEVYLHTEIVTMTLLKWIGKILLWGKQPVHCRLYWGVADQNSVMRYFMTELTSDAPTSITEIVGKGEGYTIQITPVFYPEGMLIPGADAKYVDDLARNYANTNNGDLTDSFHNKDFYSTPQGYGGPMYDRATSNTYAKWILEHVCTNLPAEPQGAIGWNTTPMFPGPKKGC